MAGFIDLHTHSTASDGSMSPRELVRYAKDSGLAAIALTDHDTIEGIETALDEGEKTGLEVIPGVEISVDYSPEMHILGYFQKEKYKNIRPILERLQKNRDERNPKIIRKLNELGFDISMQEVEAEALGNIVGRPHIAKVLVSKGYISCIEDAFKKYLGSGKTAYVKKDKLSPHEGVRMISESGGLAVLAHPLYLYLSHRQLDELVESIKPYGLKGIEAYYVDNTDDDTGNFLRLVIKHDLIATGGSDFHGSFKNGIDIGKGRGNLRIPYDLLTKLKSSFSSQ